MSSFSIYESDISKGMSIDTDESFQMPIIDGMQATELIREFETSTPDIELSESARLNGRIPIFAVSASLLEKEMDEYIKVGFDGWIMKPIDFKRLNVFGLRDRSVLESTPVYHEHCSNEGGQTFFRPQDVHFEILL
jgi:hypothetical protein